jgi:hypothetical protein
MASNMEITIRGISTATSFTRSEKSQLARVSVGMPVLRDGRESSWRKTSLSNVTPEFPI